jgi:hypothetical protein
MKMSCWPNTSDRVQPDRTIGRNCHDRDSRLMGFQRNILMITTNGLQAAATTELSSPGVATYGLAGTFAVAILLALSFIRIAKLLRREKLLYAAGLALSALVYPASALIASRHEDLSLELGGLFVFSTLAFLGMKRDARWLSIGWGGHAMWDVIFPSAPWWYIHGCVAFDFFLAGYIVGHLPAAVSDG